MDEELYEPYNKEIAFITAQKEMEDWFEYQEELKKTKKEAKIEVYYDRTEIDSREAIGIIQEGI